MEFANIIEFQMPYQGIITDICINSQISGSILGRALYDGDLVPEEALKAAR